MPKGTVHIVRNFYTTDAEGVYDMAFTPEGQQEPDPEQVIRRFYGEQELGEFLKHHLHVPQARTDDLVRDVVREKHASIPDLEFRAEELRDLKLAA
jgi:hypothetical protein